MEKHLQQMAKQGELSSHIHFFRIILTEMLEKRTLELPRDFVKEHLKGLSKHVYLRVPTGTESKVELERRNGRAWLKQGWQDFVNKYSIKCGYFLVFNYEGESCFTVLIFDLSTWEIEYPVSSATTCNEKAEKPKLIEVKEEEDEILYEFPKRKMTKKLRTGESVIESKGVGVISARDKVLEKAKAFQSPNFHFIVKMQPTYISRPYLSIPESPARSYFHQKGNNNISMKGPDGRAWSMKYTVGAPPHYRVTISSGWDKFSKENHLQEGDVCVFELVNSKAVVFKVTIFRIYDDEEQAEKKDPQVVITNVASHSNKRVLLVTSNATERVLERAGSFKCKCKNPHFMIRMTSYSLSRKPKVHIPSPHSRRYLKEDNGDKNVIIIHGTNGNTWVVHYHSYIRSPILKRTFISKGWKGFASENRLQVGDVLVFEMINGKAKAEAYKVTIFRVVDHK